MPLPAYTFYFVANGTSPPRESPRYRKLVAPLVAGFGTVGEARAVGHKLAIRVEMEVILTQKQRLRIRRQAAARLNEGY